jgi:thioredoxin reductase (NADPH)
MLGIESERAFFGAGVSTCATCDGFFYKDKDAVVIGAGDTAAEEALYLSNICKVVHILVRKDKMRAAQYLQDRILKTSNIVLHFSTEVEQFLGDSTLKGVMTNKGYIINAEAAFIAIGHEPNTKLFENTNLLIDREHYTIVKNSANTLTNIAGVFACGDVADHTYRQAVVAAGDGARAAIDAQRYMLTR